MKSEIKQRPAILGDAKKPKNWQLTIRTPSTNTVMVFDSQELAHKEYNRIKNSSIYGEQWISEIVLKEL